MAGFWLGLWHGLIASFPFVVSLFKDDIGIYEAHNNGRWYNFGFIFGLMIIFGGNKGAQIKIDGRDGAADVVALIEWSSWSTRDVLLGAEDLGVDVLQPVAVA